MDSGLGDAVIPDPVASCRQSGKQSGPGGHAHRIGDVGPGEDGPASGEGVDVGSPNDGMPRVPITCRAVLIGSNDEEVGS